MAEEDMNGSVAGEQDLAEDEKIKHRHKHNKHKAAKPKKRDGDRVSEDDESEDESDRSRRRKRRRRRSSRSRSDEEDSEDSDFSSSSETYSDSDSESESTSEEEMRRRRRKRKRREREYETERRRRRKEKEKRKRRKEKEEKERKRKEKKKKRKKEKDMGKTGAVTNSWGKYGIIREIDMWNKRPEFTAWLAEVKQVNLESMANWEEKQMFKEFMEDHNTATFPSKKYYNLDAYHQRRMIKEIQKGRKRVSQTERTVFNDEEQLRQERIIQREKQKEAQVEELKRSMQMGMAQAMKEQVQLKEEMAFQYKLGNFEAAAAIQRRLDPDVAM